MRDTWWLWLIGVAFVGAAIVSVAVFAVRHRFGVRRPPAGTRTRAPKGRPGRAGLSRPQPGEIWWAEVPFEDRTGSKVRPCLVLRTGPKLIDVLKITSQDQSDRRDHLEIPTQSWDRRATHNSFLDLSDPFRLTDAAFERIAGVVDERTWTVVRATHRRRTRS